MMLSRMNFGNTTTDADEHSLISTVGNSTLAPGQQEKQAQPFQDSKQREKVSQGITEDRVKELIQEAVNELEKKIQIQIELALQKIPQLVAQEMLKRTENTV